MIPRLKTIYKDKIVPEIMKIRKYKNVHQVCRIEKIVLSICAGNCFRNIKEFEEIKGKIESIGLQKSIVLKAKTSIANFNLREGMNIGYKITLRKNRMYFFLDRLINLVFVLNRDFKGISSKAISGNKKGGFTINLGINDLSEFPEVDRLSLNKSLGMGINICTNAKSFSDCKLLLQKFNMPFIEKKEE